MPVLIDGNNLLFAARAVEDPDRLMGRSMLCDALRAWATRRRERVHVVFDGAPPPEGLAAQIGHGAIEVSYSGGGVSADTAIMRLLSSDSAARRLLVVSSDREVVRAAKRRKAKPVGSAEFWAMVKRDAARPLSQSLEPPEKETGLSAGATEAWLRELGLDDGSESGSHPENPTPGGLS